MASNANADQVVIGSNGNILVAPVGTPMPTNIATAFNAGYVDLGFASEDGVDFSDSKDTEDIGAWQTFYPIRKNVTSRETTVSFVLRQWNAVNVKLAFGGGTIENDVGPPEVSRYLPPAPGDIDFRSLAVEWFDGTRGYRLIVPRGMVTDEVSTKLARTEAADLPISFSAMPLGVPVAGDETTFPFYIITNDASFGP